MKIIIWSIITIQHVCIENLSASNQLTPTAQTPSEINIQYKWFDSARNRSIGLAPKRGSIPQAATNQYQRIKFTLFFDSSKSVYEVLEHIKAVLGLPSDDLNVRLGNNRKDRVIDIPLHMMKQKTIKVRYVQPKVKMTS